MSSSGCMRLTGMGTLHTLRASVFDLMWGLRTAAVCIHLTIRSLDKGGIVRVRSIRQFDIGRYASENVNKLLVGNKCDLEPKRAVSTEQAKVSWLPLDMRAILKSLTHIAANMHGVVRARVFVYNRARALCDPGRFFSEH